MAKALTAEQRTISMFTGKTDVEAPNARDGSYPDEMADFSHIRMRPKFKWQRFELTRYTCDAINALIQVENEFPKEKNGRWFYRVYKKGHCIGVFDTICEAANNAEAA